jgi:hypothetical protein
VLHPGPILDPRRNGRISRRIYGTKNCITAEKYKEYKIKYLY